MVELVDTLVLEASTSVCEFESRLGHQNSECSAVWLAHLLWEQRVVSSNPTIPTNLTQSVRSGIWQGS